MNKDEDKAKKISNDLALNSVDNVLSCRQRITNHNKGNVGTFALTGGHALEAKLDVLTVDANKLLTSGNKTTATPTIVAFEEIEDDEEA